eukprot:SAG25_NODE_13272_length_269_cov_0.611765_1_plen_38_part_01
MHELLHREMRELGALGIALVVEKKEPETGVVVGRELIH